MYITEVLTKTKKGKISHTCTLLRHSYRENGKVKVRTIANLTHCKPEEIAAIKLALKHKGDLSVLKSLDSIELNEGMSVGAAYLVYDVARKLGIDKALGGERAGTLALWLVMARVIDQGSRLSAVRLAQVHAACDILGLRKGFNEDELYKNLGWLSENQEAIEKRLFNKRYHQKKPELFLYDVTSSYFEGQHNELSEWGYNRDRKKGTKQVVIGLLCDEEGEPVSVKVYTGSTRDFDTFGDQVKQLADVFGCRRVTMVGDRGMIKRAQIEALKEGFTYITAITKPQIKKLIKDGVFQFELFEDELCEIEDGGVRYLLRRNPTRAKEIAENRKEKKKTVEKLCQKKNEYLAEHKRAKVTTAIKAIDKKINQLKISWWISVESVDGALQLKEDESALAEESRLDGCYVIKSDLPNTVDKEIIHDRYKDLAEVEQAFRTCKTGHLEMRPWHVRLEKSTRGHALVVMLAYRIVHYLQTAWKSLDITVEEGLKKLSNLTLTEMVTKEGGSCHRIPRPQGMTAELLKATDVHMPRALAHMGANVVSRKKLQKSRKTD